MVERIAGVELSFYREREVLSAGFAQAVTESHERRVAA
jgi:hypothetical protein